MFSSQEIDHIRLVLCQYFDLIKADQNTMVADRINENVYNYTANVLVQINPNTIHLQIQKSFPLLWSTQEFSKEELKLYADIIYVMLS